MKRSTAILASFLLLFASVAPALTAQAQTEETENLESYLNGMQPTGIYQPNNPWLNPGFEVTTGADVPGVVLNMVAPPTYFRSTLDEQNPDDPDATPYSKQEIALGEGTTGNALRILWNTADNERAVSLGQGLGQPGQPYGYRNATTLEFDFQTDVTTQFTITLYHAPAFGEASTYVRDLNIPAVEPTNGEWTRVVANVPVDNGDVLTHAIIRIQADANGEMLFDNVQITGSEFSPISTKSDASDGFAVFLRGEYNTENGVSLFRTINTSQGPAYLVSAKVRDFTDGTPRWVDVSKVPGNALHILGGDYLAAGFQPNYTNELHAYAFSTNGTEALYVVPKDHALGLAEEGLASMYAFFRVGEDYNGTFGDAEPAYGHYHPVKDLLQDNAYSDLMDPMHYPLRFLDEQAGELVQAEMGLAILNTTSSEESFTVRITYPKTGWAETTTLNVTGFPEQVVTLDGSGENVTVTFPGSGDGLTATTTDTLFLVGGEYVALDPVADINITPTGAQSFEDITFNASGSEEFQDADIASYEWEFGDGTGDSGPVVTHAYARSGTYQVNLTVTDEKGRANRIYTLVDVGNRAPTVTVEPSVLVTRVEKLLVKTSAFDPDGDVERLVIGVDNVTRYDGKLKPSVMLSTGALELGEHVLTAYVVDNLGGVSEVANVTFQVENLAPGARVFSDRGLVAGGEAVTFTTESSDEDGTVQNSSLDFGDGTTVDNPGPTTTHTYSESGTYAVYYNVTDADGATTSTLTLVSVDADTPETAPAFSRPASSGWHDGGLDVLLDVNDGGPALTTAYFRENITGDEAFALYEGGIPVSGEGDHVIEFYAEDEVGHRESVQSLTVRIDETMPGLDANGMPVDGDVVGGIVDLTGVSSDALSGVAVTRLLIDGAEVARASGDTVTYAWDTRADLFASHEVTLEAVDVAGHVNATTVTVYVLNLPDPDNLDPEAGARVDGHAYNNGDNATGMPTEGATGTGVTVFLDGFAVQVELPERGQAVNGTQAFAGLLVDSAAAGESTGGAGLSGSVFAFGAQCTFYTWGGGSNPAYTPRVTCGLP